MTDAPDLRKQRLLLLAIARFVRQHGYAPSVRDLQAACGFSSTSVTTYHLELLRERGLVTWTPRVARSIRLVKPA